LCNGVQSDRELNFKEMNDEKMIGVVQ